MKLAIALTFAAVTMAQTPSWVFTSGGMPMPGGVVTGAPYSAEQISQQVQTLADGTHITQPQGSVKYYRDSMGRTRTERTLTGPPGFSGFTPPTMIEIFDPVAGAHYMIDERSRTAQKMSIRTAPPPPPPPPGASSALTTAGRIVRTRAPVDTDAQRPKTTRESLGTQTIEGVSAEGTRTTVTYPVGSIGNDRPVTTTTETWTSPELKTTILKKSSDPRYGDSTTRLTNISRAEPDPSLFQVPADYEIIDDQNPATRR